MLQESCTALSSFARDLGYSTVDRMAVMLKQRSPIAMNPKVHVREASSKEVGEWCKTYLLAFYEDLSLKPQVMRLVRRLTGVDSVTLLMADFDGGTAGVTALYRTPGLLGLYCLGTPKRYRGKGVAHTLLGYAHALAKAEGRRLVLQSLLSEGAASFYLKAGFRELYAKDVLSNHKAAALPHGKGGRMPKPVATVRRGVTAGPHLFTRVFEGFDRVRAVRRIFGGATTSVLSELLVDVVNEKGYMHINAVKGSIVVSAGYLREGDERYLYLDAIHELVHIKQHMDGKELWDRRYKYVERPTELEAYRVAIDEARRIGMTDEQLVDYLKVEWVSEDDFRQFLVSLGVDDGRRNAS